MRDNARYEYALAVKAVEEAREAGASDDLYAVAAGMARVALRAIYEGAGGRPDAMLLLFMRGSGMSLREMGRSLGTSHQAVLKRLKRLARRHPSMADYIRSGNPLDLYTEITQDAKDDTASSDI